MAGSQVGAPSLYTLAGPPERMIPFGRIARSSSTVIVGATSAGNVEAVLPFCLRDGAQAWLATGVLAPLRGATWEGRGVVPDVAVEPAAAAETARALLLEARARP